MDFYSFYTGQEFEAYEYLGAHYTREETWFRTFAPKAHHISLLLADGEHPMQKCQDSNFYEVKIEKLKEGTTYEYRIYTSEHAYTDHCDPYGFGMELRPAHKSIVRDLGKYKFKDKAWLAARQDTTHSPVNIYEMHAGSFRKPGENPEDWYTYEELGKVLIPHLKESGYNYVEFLPLSEHPCDESWGYQNTGFYAPTSRYGTAAQLQKLIDELHKNKIGVIMDFVPVHFAIDAYALKNYDGDELYEYPSSDVSVSEWGSCNFMHSRGEIRSFLQSAANYWMTMYHADGIRVDAISRIIYWQGDEKRGVNGNAVDFIKVMNRGLKDRHPGCILAAEDSTNYGGVTKPVNEGGLGFDYKWNMGWMHDTLNYFQTGPEYRSENYHKLTFSMMYAYDEHFLLPLSHDEVVHGKATIAQKMAGGYEDKFPQARILYLYMMMHPGKKLNFMGNEIAQLREWDEKREQDWMLLDYPIHDAFYHYICELNQLYLEHPAMYERDFDREGFSWIDCHQEHRCIYAFQRKSQDETLLLVFNLSDQKQTGYEVPVLEPGDYEVLLDTQWARFGGEIPEKKTKNTEALVYKKKITLDLMRYEGILLKKKSCTTEEEGIKVPEKNR